MRMRNYEIRPDTKKPSWNLHRVAASDEQAAIVASYLTKADALASAERLCMRIAIDAYTVGLVVVDEHGCVESNRVFSTFGPSTR